MPGIPGVERDQQVETLLLPDLADEQAVGPHAQRLLDEATLADLAFALEVGLPGLHGDRVGQVHLELEDLLAGDHPFTGRDGRGQAVEGGGLAGLGGPGDDDVEPGDHRRLEEPGALTAHRAQADQLAERVRAEHEPSDVDRPVTPGDVGDDHVEPGAVAQGRVDERLLVKLVPVTVSAPAVREHPGAGKEGVLPCPMTVPQRAAMRCWWMSLRRPAKSRGSFTKRGTCTCPLSPGSATGATRWSAGRSCSTRSFPKSASDR
jgi:hypothetical protein